MSTFPTLKTGATVQYPAQRATEFSTDVIRFVDGSEQRFRGYQTLLKRWSIRLDLLDETEMHGLREFFRTQRGAAESFSFTDPWDGAVYPNCSLSGNEIAEQLDDTEQGKTTLTVTENRS
jgi:phage-related protein